MKIRFLSRRENRNCLPYKAYSKKGFLLSMMNEFKLGEYAVSAAGHDSGKCYVIIQIDHEYVYLVDGKIRTLSNPKKKKIKHIKKLNRSNQNLVEKVMNSTVKDEEIKRAIKILNCED